MAAISWWWLARLPRERKTKANGALRFTRWVLASLAAPMIALAPLGHAIGQSIDPCLVGTWEARAVSYLSNYGPAIGGNGFRVIIETDGTLIVDYSKMTPFEWPPVQGVGDIQIWRGAATVRISTNRQTARIEEVKVARVEMSISRNRSFQPMGWGPGVLGSSQDDGYTCTADTLRYRSATFYNAAKQLDKPQFAVELTRIKSAAPPAPDVAMKGRTWLTVTEIKDRPQDLRGVWLEPQSGGGPETRWLDVTPGGQLYDNDLATRGNPPASIEMMPEGDLNWRGRVHVCPRGGACPKLCRWVDGSVATDALNLRISGEWRHRKHKPDCSGFSDEPDSGTFVMRRFLGASFVPIAAGKYMNLVGAPAVGNQPTQFKAAVRVSARYEAIQGATVRATADRGGLTLVDKAKGIYDFAVDRSGTYELTFELVDGNGQVFHTDRMRVEIPGIPGLGK